MNARAIRRIMYSVYDWFPSLTGARTINLADDHLKTFVLNAAAGQAITLPTSIGDGLIVRFLVGTTITSNTTTIKVGKHADIMQGTAYLAESGTLSAFLAGAADDTITLNGSTTGGIIGDRIDFFDMAKGKWQVTVWAQGSGTMATPFSSTV